MEEIVQLYVGYPEATVTRPTKELKAFERVFLKAGEEKTVTLTVKTADLAYYNEYLREFVTERGRYDLRVGASSRDIRLTQSIYCNAATPYTMSAKGETMVG